MKRFFLTCFIFLVITDLFAVEYLLKIPQNSDRQLQVLRDQYQFKLRFRSNNFSLVQAVGISSEAKVLDRISSDFNYFVLATQGSNRIADIKEYKILERFDGFTLIKLHVAFESMLFNIRGHCSKLPV